MTPQPNNPGNGNPPTPPRKKYKDEQHNVILRRDFAVALQATLENMLGGKIKMSVKSSSITHTSLQPEGDLLTITFAVEFHEKVETPNP